MAVAVTVVQPWGIYESAANRWDFGYFDSAAVCAESTRERCQVKGGRTLSGFRQPLERRSLLGCHCLIGGDRVQFFDRPRQREAAGF